MYRSLLIHLVRLNTRIAWKCTRLSETFHRVCQIVDDLARWYAHVLQGVNMSRQTQTYESTSEVDISKSNYPCI